MKQEKPAPVLEELLRDKAGEAATPRRLHDLAEKVHGRLQNLQPPSPPTWRERLAGCDRMLMLVYGSGVAVCALLAYTLINSRHVKPPPPQATKAVAPHLAAMAPDAQLGTAPPVPAPQTQPTDAPRSTAPATVNTGGDRVPVRTRPASLTPADKKN